MKLLVDIGNTRIKWARCDGGRLSPPQSVAHRDLDLSTVLDDGWGGIERPRAVWIASVLGTERQRAVAEWMIRRWDLQPRFVTSQAEQLGVRNGYRDPSRLGVDRWVALLAARARFHEPVCVVDFGSALTIDAIDGSGNHLGGLIVPGLRTMHRSLTGGDINLDAGTPETTAIAEAMGRDTAEAVGYGIRRCLAHFVDGVCGDVERKLGEATQRVITGGDAEQLKPLLRGRYHHVAELVLEGLALIAEEDGA
ncbi:MAG: pantothenate kinase [Gammaproteobacteria bacterium]